MKLDEARIIGVQASPAHGRGAFTPLQRGNASGMKFNARLAFGRGSGLKPAVRHRIKGDAVDDTFFTTV
jgi:hypothetical protein